MTPTPLPDDPFPEPDPQRSRPSDVAWLLCHFIDWRWGRKSQQPKAEEAA